MPFRINDLIINIAPRPADEAAYPHIECVAGTWCGCSRTKNVPTNELLLCGGLHSIGCGATPTITNVLCWIGLIPSWEVSDDPAAARENLAQLRAQLKDALAEIEREEAEARKAPERGSVDEIEALENKLQAALETLDKRKKQLARNKTSSRKAARKRKSTRRR